MIEKGNLTFEYKIRKNVKKKESGVKIVYGLKLRRRRFIERKQGTNS